MTPAELDELTALHFQLAGYILIGERRAAAELLRERECDDDQFAPRLLARALDDTAMLAGQLGAERGWNTEQTAAWLLSFSDTEVDQ